MTTSCCRRSNRDGTLLFAIRSPTWFLLLTIVILACSNEAVPLFDKQQNKKSNRSSILGNNNKKPTLQQQQTTFDLHNTRGGSQRKNKGESDVVVEVGDGTATIGNEIFNLVKCIVGAGVLSLPAGIAAFGNTKSAAIPATILTGVIGALSAYGFSLIGRVCSGTGSKSFREAWDKTVGPSTSWITAFSSTFSCFCANLAYSMILADTFKNLLSSVGFNTITRTHTLLGVTCFVLVPLCLLRDLSALAPFSLLGILGMAYTSLAMIVRYLDGSYNGTEGKFVPDLTIKPKFGTTKGIMSVFSPSASILLGMLSTAYMAHFNAPKFFVELKNNTVLRFNVVTYSSFIISIGIFSVVAAVGYFTFGESCDGLILNNYSNNDSLMGLSRVAVAISIVFSFPLVFVGMREGLLDLLNVSVEKRQNSPQMIRNLTLGVLSIITLLAFVVKDLSFVLSFAGATLGNALIYVFPALMFRSMRKNNGRGGFFDVEVGLAMFSCAFGIVMGVMGAVEAIKSLSSS